MSFNYSNSGNFFASARCYICITKFAVGENEKDVNHFDTIFICHDTDDDSIFISMSNHS